MCFQDVFGALQDPVINKHLSYVLFDTAVAELFPELEEEVKAAAAAVKQ